MRDGPRFISHGESDDHDQPWDSEWFQDAPSFEKNPRIGLREHLQQNPIFFGSKHGKTKSQWFPDKIFPSTDPRNVQQAP